MIVACPAETRTNEEELDGMALHDTGIVMIGKEQEEISPPSLSLVHLVMICSWEEESFQISSPFDDNDHRLW